MKINFLKGLLILVFVFLTACSGSQPIFTPPVIEVPKVTNTVEAIVNTPIVESLQEKSETPTQIIEKQEERLESVTSFPDSSQYQWVEIASGFNRPLGMASYFDESLLIYLLEQEGIIRVIENEILLSEPFLDISNKIRIRGSEQGLLGIALDLDFAENGIFYLNYTDRQGDTVIARYIANDNRKTANSNSEQIILTNEQPYSNHNGGNLVFGPDGYLYIGLGDGGSGGDPELRSQNPNVLLGKMLRIAVQDQEFYAIPSDNPFQDRSGRSEIWAMGLRNPWRYSFDHNVVPHNKMLLKSNVASNNNVTEQFSTIMLP